MDEFWVCQHCKSLNRMGSGKCYSCGRKFGSKPLEAEGSRQAVAAVTLPPLDARAPAKAPPAAKAGPAAPYVVPNADALPSYLSRPASPANVAMPYLTDAEPKGRLPSPTRFIERRIARALSVRPIVSVAAIGWFTIVSLVVVTVVGGLLAMTGLPAIAYALQHADLPGGWNQLSAGQQSFAKTFAIAEIAAFLVALVSFSLFVGLSTHNVTGLGAGVTLLMPRSGGTIWPSLVWVHLRMAFGFIAPVLLIFYGYELPGLILAILVVEVLQRHSDDAFDWLERPANHLCELHRKLGIESTKTSNLATVWATAFRTANLSAALLYLLPAFGLTAAVAMRVSGHELALWQETGNGPGQLAFLVVIATLGVSAVLTLLTTMVMVLGLMARQRTRRTLVRVGRSRSWTARPGEGYAAGAAGVGGFGGVAAGAAGDFGDGLFDQDRVIERRVPGTLPGYASPTPAATPTPTPSQAGRWPGGQEFAPETPATWPGARPLAPEPGRWPGAQAPAPETPPAWPGDRPLTPITAAPFVPPPFVPPPFVPAPAAPFVAPPAVSPPAVPPPAFAPPPLPAPRPPAMSPADSAAALFRRSEGGTPRPGGIMSRVQSGLAAQAQRAAQSVDSEAQENGAPSSGAPSPDLWPGGDQASLNSPSTTSSWSPDEPSEPPSD